jgi:hypothetical protein
MGGPKVGTGTWSGHKSALSTALWASSTPRAQSRWHACCRGSLVRSDSWSVFSSADQRRAGGASLLSESEPVRRMPLDQTSDDHRRHRHAGDAGPFPFGVTGHAGLAGPAPGGDVVARERLGWACTAPARSSRRWSFNEAEVRAPRMGVAGRASVRDEFLLQ